MTDRKTIFAIHGAGLNAAVWGPSLPQLLDYTFRTLSLPGHDAGLPAAPLATIAEMAAWGMRKLDREKSGNVALLGHSMGALVALDMAQHPAVSHLVLAGAAAAMPVNDALLQSAKDDPAAAIAQMAKWSVWKELPAADATRTFMADVMAKVPAPALYIDLKACNDYADGARAAALTDKPVLVLSGVADKMARPSDAESLASLCAKGGFKTIEACGHMPMIEQPAALAAEIKAFLQN